jgi:hypothetical protein
VGERIYIEGDNARITKGEGILLNVELYDGQKFYDLEARRLFPITGLLKYITLLDSDDKEIACIRDVTTLMEDSKNVVLKSLEEYYLIPKITNIVDSYQKSGIFKMIVDTDRGPYKFDVNNHYYDIEIFYDGRILIRDSSDNRYEIPNWNKLDKKSIKHLNYDL